MHLARPTALKTLDKYLTTNVSYPELISSPVHRSKWPLSALLDWTSPLIGAVLIWLCSFSSCSCGLFSVQAPR
jgi:hypothetical protein